MAAAEAGEETSNVEAAVCGIAADELATLRAAGLEPHKGVPGLFLRKTEDGDPIVPTDPITLTGRAQELADAMRDELVTRLREKGTEGLPTTYFHPLKGERADLMGAWLQGAILYKAQLQGADLREAQLQGAYLRDAQLQGADLSKAQLQGANLSIAQLQDAFLYEAQLTDADLTKAQLTEANLRGAHLQGANFQAAQLEGANISEVTNMQKASFVGAKLVGANLAKSNLAGADFTSADLTKANLNEALKSMHSYRPESTYSYGDDFWQDDDDDDPFGAAAFNVLLIKTVTVYEVRSGFKGSFDMLKMALKVSRIDLTNDERQLVYLSEELKKLKDKDVTADNWRDAVEGWISVLELRGQFRAPRLEPAPRGQLRVECGQSVLECIVADDKVLQVLGAAKALMHIEGVPPAALISMITQGPGGHLRKHGYRYTWRLDDELVRIQRIKELKMLASTSICIPLAVGTCFVVIYYFSGAMYNGASKGFGSQPTMVWVLPILFVAGMLVLCCCVGLSTYLCREKGPLRACISPEDEDKGEGGVSDVPAARSSGALGQGATTGA